MLVRLVRLLAGLRTLAVVTLAVAVITLAVATTAGLLGLTVLIRPAPGRLLAA